MRRHLLQKVQAMTVEEFEARMRESKEQAEVLIEQMKTAPAAYDALYPLIHDYVYLKFWLFDGEEETDAILELADISTEKIAELKKGGLVVVERSGTCGSISSAVTKKILLLMALQQALGIVIEHHAAADITTLSELTNAVIEGLE